MCSPVNFCDISKKTFFTEHLWVAACLNHTHGQKLNSVQELVKAKSRQLLTFSTCLQSQLKFRSSIELYL